MQPDPISASFRKKRISERLESIVLAFEVILAVRLALLLLGYHSADALQGFFGLSQLLTQPFQGLLPTFEVGTAYFDPATALSLTVLPLAGGLLIFVVDHFRLYRKRHLVSNR